MAAVTLQQARFLKNLFGNYRKMRGGPEDPTVIEGAGQTFTKMGPVAWSSSKLVETGASAIDAIAGQVSAAASGTTSNPTKYYPMQPGDVYVVNVEAADAAADCAIGLAYEFVTTSHLLLLDPDTQDKTHFYGVVMKYYTVANGFPDGDTSTDTGSRVVVWIPAQASLQG